MKGKVCEMLCGPGGVLGCRGKAGQLVVSSSGRPVRKAVAGARLGAVNGDGGAGMSGS